VQSCDIFTYTENITPKIPETKEIKLKADKKVKVQKEVENITKQTVKKKSIHLKKIVKQFLKLLTFQLMKLHTFQKLEEISEKLIQALILEHIILQHFQNYLKI
jgi:3-methyladenine DNA glycosylase AlkC